MKLFRAAAFSSGGKGGNPAGVAICSKAPSESTMQALARDVGYSEVAFLHPERGSWRVRYFAPEIEIPFCGHATIAAGAVLGLNHGVGQYDLKTNLASVPVVASMSNTGWMARFVSPRTFTRELAPSHVERLRDCFGLATDELDAGLPPRLMNAGANHALISLRSRRRLSHMGYAFNELLQVKRELDLATVTLVYRESDDVFHARNPFAAGGVYEDPATGAAAAALAGYLRDLGIKRSGSLRIIQGEDMGRRSEIFVDYDAARGTGVRIAGEVSVWGSSQLDARLVAVD